MAETTKFGHDQLGHILADHLLEVPRFQRSYSWDSGNVDEFLADLEGARDKDVDYFMGTVVFARPDTPGARRQIVDGQQRLATTALLLVAVRDVLRTYARDRQAEELEKRFLRGYVISMDETVERLILSPDDLPAYHSLLEEKPEEISQGSRIRQGYETCVRYLQRLAPSAEQVNRLIELVNQLENRVQVLVAEASDLPEAYVIFETLNDRGADLTTADLLKNYLFSSARDYFQFVESRWAQLEADFDRPEDLVKFIRYDHASRHGSVSGRHLYRAIQAKVGWRANAAKNYVEGLLKAQEVYLAIRDPEHSYWADLNVEVRDALYAYRRFGFEASIPVLLAAFANWTKTDAARLLIKIANWSVRAQFAGRLGGGVADETFGETARAISEGTAKNQAEVRGLLARLISSDAEFVSHFIAYGDVSTSRAKYLLAMLEKADDAKNQRPEKAVDWHSRSITIEHVMPLASVTSSEAEAAVINKIGNLALLEKRLNRSAGSKPFAEKRDAYKNSTFELTRRLAAKRIWKPKSVADRTKELAELACLAWPAT